MLESFFAWMYKDFEAKRLVERAGIVGDLSTFDGVVHRLIYVISKWKDIQYGGKCPDLMRRRGDDWISFDNYLAYFLYELGWRLETEPDFKLLKNALLIKLKSCTSDENKVHEVKKIVAEMGGNKRWSKDIFSPTICFGAPLLDEWVEARFADSELANSIADSNKEYWMFSNSSYFINFETMHQNVQVFDTLARRQDWATFVDQNSLSKKVKQEEEKAKLEVTSFLKGMSEAQSYVDLEVALGELLWRIAPDNLWEGVKCNSELVTFYAKCASKPSILFKPGERILEDEVRALCGTLAHLVSARGTVGIVKQLKQSFSLLPAEQFWFLQIRIDLITPNWELEPGLCERILRAAFVEIIDPWGYVPEKIEPNQNLKDMKHSEKVENLNSLRTISTVLFERKNYDQQVLLLKEFVSRHKNEAREIWKSLLVDEKFLKGLGVIETWLQTSNAYMNRNGSVVDTLEVLKDIQKQLAAPPL